VRRRLLATNAVIALAAVLVLGVPLAIVEAHRERADAETQLEREADAVGAAVDDRLEGGRWLDAATLRRRVRPGHEATIRTRRGTIVHVGGPVRGDRITVGSGAASSARVTASAPSSEVTARIERRWALIALLSGAGVAAAVALGAVQGRRLARPLEQLARTSTRLGDGDFSTRAERSAIAEIDAVAAALDSTAIRIARLLGREREFAANAAHQLRTPLTALRLRLEEIKTLDGEDVGAETAKALHEVDRLQATITDLLAHAEDGRAGDAGPLDVAELVRAHADRWRPLYLRVGRPLAVEAAASATAAASRGAVGQAVDVLIENALEHGGGAVTVSVEDRDGRAVIAVADEGEGVPAGTERAIFARGGSPAGGTGVGLHLARALVEADGGRLRLVRPRPARFEIALPG
jgi:signal transduction histidine kinase